jgi:hypothetical protein
MTSTIEAIAKPDVSLRTILDAVFPCGSVTGAPKKRSMEIIQELEGSPRDYYCGALGWLDPNGDFAFSVPIRTLNLDSSSNSHPTKFTLGIGAGITIDSDPLQEWQECQTKSAFITEMPTELGLFETIRVEGQKPLRFAAHLQRLQQSASALRIPFEASRIAEAAEEAEDRPDAADEEEETEGFRVKVAEVFGEDAVIESEFGDGGHFLLVILHVEGGIGTGAVAEFVDTCEEETETDPEAEEEVSEGEVPAAGGG